MRRSLCSHMLWEWVRNPNTIDAGFRGKIQIIRAVDPMASSVFTIPFTSTKNRRPDLVKSEEVIVNK